MATGLPTDMYCVALLLPRSRVVSLLAMVIRTCHCCNLRERERLPGCRHSNRLYPATSGPPLTTSVVAGMFIFRPIPRLARPQQTHLLSTLIHMIHSDSSVNCDHSLASVNKKW
ncbi:hypothetical protein F5141DRAFT_1103117 [Pisolithus sp. B1]|nr:hypothetical protein F5141DRAFT_1103117 [Pisolithus sp. B1]